MTADQRRSQPRTENAFLSFSRCLKGLVDKASPGGHGGDAGALGVDVVPVELTAARVDIHLGSSEPTGALPEETDDPEEDDDEEGEVSVEELLDGLGGGVLGNDGGVELSDENDDNDNETKPRAVDTTSSLERNLVKGVAVVSPGLAETNVGQADGSPGEESGKTRERDEPSEDDFTTGSQVHVGKSAHEQDGANRHQGTARAVNVGEDLGSVALLGKGGEGTGATVDTGHTDGNDGYQDDDVHEGVETDETGVLADNDERRGLDIDVTGTEQTLIVVADEETDESKTENVEEGDTPEDLFDSSGKRPDGVFGLSSGQTDKLGSRVSESGVDEDGAETLEATLESTRIVPVACAPVLVELSVAGTTTEDADQGDDHEDDGGNKLEARCPKLFFGVTQRTPNVQKDDDDPEDGDPCTLRHRVSPICDSETGDSDFKR